MIELAGAVILGLFSIIMAVSIAGALFRGSEIFFGLGNFFVDALGILAFGIPIYLFCAALLLASPIYRPDRIFILSCSLIPFVTLAIGFVFIRDFDYWSTQFDLFYWAGKGGFNLFIILLTIIEGLIIVAFTSMLFPQGRLKEEAAEFENSPVSKQSEESLHYETLWQRSKPFWESAKGRAMLLIPDRLWRKSQGIPTNLEESKPNYEDLYFKELNNTEGIDIEGIRLPDIKPLASASAMSKLETLSAYYKEPVPDESAEARYTTHTTYPDEGIDIIIEPLVEEAPTPGEEPLLKRTIVSKVEEVPYPPIRVSSSWESYRIPVKGILNQYQLDQTGAAEDQSIIDAAVILKETLREFNIQAEVIGIWKGPAITMFEIVPAGGVKLSKIINLQDNIALKLSASSIRIVPPVPGKHAVGIEVPSTKRTIVSFGEILKEDCCQEGKSFEIPVILGKDITGETWIVDLVQTPHLLVAGAPGSGKSVCLNCLVLSILYQMSPVECRLIMIDPNIAELKVYNDIPHLLTPVITDSKRAFQALQYCIFEMERRYACLDSLGVRDIRSYNKRIKERGIGVEPLPYIVIAINEFADLMVRSGKEFESTLAQLAAMSRTVGIHLVLATQYPSIDVITGLIKANIPSRIAFMVASKIDSRLILDASGAEKLLGRGDMLYTTGAGDIPVRMQGAYISEEEVERAVEYIKTLGYPDYIDDELFIDDDEGQDALIPAEEEDPLYERAVAIIIQEGKADAGYLQRRLKIGYNRAVRLIDRMEQQGLIILSS
ncbi:MAG: DNA translocase FtsK [Treponema sp.]|nr:DNA translocase FtsK [Treponema sp.]